MPSSPNGTARFSLPPDCPPVTASLRHQTVYLVVADDPPQADDLASLAQRRLAPGLPACRRAAVSVFDTHAAARHRMALSPYLGRKVAWSMISPCHGPLSRPQPGGHLLWWPLPTLVAPPRFEVVREH